MVHALSIGGGIVAVITILANLTTIAQFFELRSSTIVSPDTTSAVVNDMLEFCDSLPTQTNRLDVTIASLESSCANLDVGLKLLKCRMVLGGIYNSNTRYRDALRHFALAQEIDPGIADAYYARGNVYYELALFDLLRRRRFSLEPEALRCTLYPDRRSKLILKRVEVEFNEARKLRLLSDIDPSSRIVVTMPQIVAHRENTLRNLADGATEIELHHVELMRLASWLGRIFPDDPALKRQILAMTENLFDYMQAHPNEFPGFPVFGDRENTPD